MIDIIELFAGVGGFRVGLERVNSTHHNDFFHVIWSNQYEPATKIQHASRTYCRAFGSDGHCCKDIALVDTNDIPHAQMLCAGFPCQDYSVARPLGQAEGIVGKKGVLWWEIIRILREKGADAPEILFLENVDRLLLSPAKQRGRDFAVILASLSMLGYTVEWRVINAADYGMPQRRRRTYILAYKNGSALTRQVTSPQEWVLHDGVFATAFPCKNTTPCETLRLFAFGDTLADVSENFNVQGTKSPFLSAGMMIDNHVFTCKVEPVYDGTRMTLGDILVRGGEMPASQKTSISKKKISPNGNI